MSQIIIITGNLGNDPAMRFTPSGQAVTSFSIADSRTYVSNGETVTIAHDAEHPSRIVLPVVPVTVDAPMPPACDSLRGQPCRTYVPASNGG